MQNDNNKSIQFTIKNEYTDEKKFDNTSTEFCDFENAETIDDFVELDKDDELLHN